MFKHKYLCMAIATAVLIFLQASPMAWGQTSSASPASPQQLGQPGLQLSQPLISAPQTANTSEVVRASVRLDGRSLFAIAALDINDRTATTVEPSPIKIRVSVIEERLSRIATSHFDPKTLKVTSEIDRNSRQPILYVRYTTSEGNHTDELFTVTALDAQIRATDPETWAKELTQTVQAALIRAQQERQPEFLRHQALLAGGLLVLMGLSSLGTTYVQQRLRVERHALSAQVKESQPISSSVEPATGAVTTALLQQRMAAQQKNNVNDIQHRLLQVAQVVIWMGGCFFILGQFPYTRWLQPLILDWMQIPVKLLGVSLVTYLGIRFSAVLVDRFFWVLQNGATFAPEASQRTTLRFSTFSRVGKSIVALLVMGTGVIAALSFVGVKVGPLLAGAGIIGLGISFASQSLIKDMINGFFILLEDQYGVGDVIVVDDVSGLVENMNLRITQLRNEEGRLITIPNSAITIVQNLSKEWSRVDLRVDVAYSANLDQALKVIDQVAQEMSCDRPWKDLILEKPLLLGVDKLDHMGATVRIWIKTQPLKQWDVAREYRRRLKLAFDEVGIHIGVPQQSLWIDSASELEDLEDGLGDRNSP